jgi:hypothetical protein
MRSIIQATLAAFTEPSFLIGLFLLAIFLCIGRIYDSRKVRHNQA